jgi:hypothetical protein
MITLDRDAYPHIFAAVVAVASYPVLSALRSTSRDVRAEVDAHLARRLAHITLLPHPEGIKIATRGGGPLPLPTAMFRALVNHTRADATQRAVRRLLAHVRTLDITGHLATTLVADLCAAARPELVRILPSAVGKWNVDLEPAGLIDLVVFAREPWDRMSPRDGWLCADVRRLTIVYPRTIHAMHASTSILQTWIPWKPMWPPSEAAVLVSSWDGDGLPEGGADHGTAVCLAYAAAHLASAGGVVALVDCRVEGHEDEIRQRVRMVYAAKRGLLRQISGRGVGATTVSGDPHVQFMSLDEYKAMRGDVFKLETEMEV